MRRTRKQASSQSKNSAPEGKAEKKAQKDLACSGCKGLDAGHEQLRWSCARPLPRTRRLLSWFSKSPALCFKAGRLPARTCWGKKENAGEVPLRLPFSKDKVDTRVKTVAAAVRALQDARKAAAQAATSAKRVAAAAATAPSGNEVVKRIGEPTATPTSEQLKLARQRCGCLRPLALIHLLYSIYIGWRGLKKTRILRPASVAISLSP